MTLDIQALQGIPHPGDVSGGRGGSADITGLYTARYGVPKAGTKVYVQVNQVVDGWESLTSDLTPWPSSLLGPNSLLKKGVFWESANSSRELRLSHSPPSAVT